MAETVQTEHGRIDASAGHLSIRIDGRPEPQFEFALRPGRLTVAFLSSFVIQASILALVIFVGRLGLRAVGVLPDEPIPQYVFLPSTGPGGGGGGGGNEMKEPPKKAEIPKPKTVSIEPPQPKIDPAPVPQFDIPVTTLAKVELPGAMQAPAGLPSNLSQGSGRGGGGGTGVGTGVGPGTGPGLGPGSGGGAGGGPKMSGGNGVTDPVPTFNPKPNYTSDAMRARVEGEVWLECTVTLAGQCTDVRIVRSLDPKFGLDQEAVDTARRWRFKPGTFQGKPAEVIVVIGLEFHLR
jgi:protein TonB